MNALPATAETTGLAALQLFREGRDTADIAAALGMSEAHASQLIWIARCRAKNLPAEWLAPSGEVLRIASASIPKREIPLPPRARPLPCAAADQPRRDGACPPSTPPSGAHLSQQQEHHDAA